MCEAPACPAEALDRPFYPARLQRGGIRRGNSEGIPGLSAAQQQDRPIGRNFPQGNWAPPAPPQYVLKGSVSDHEPSAVLRTRQCVLQVSITRWERCLVLLAPGRDSTPQALRTEARLHPLPARAVSPLSTPPSGQHLNAKRWENGARQQEAGLLRIAWAPQMVRVG